MPARSRLAPACCPVCGHALRLVLTPDGPRRVCPLCGDISTVKRTRQGGDAN